MKKLLVSLLCVCIGVSCIYAGEKMYTFSGNVIYVNPENRILEVRQGNKKEKLFFVAGKIMQNKKEIPFKNLVKGDFVSITYLKNQRRYIAREVVAVEEQHAER